MHRPGGATAGPFFLRQNEGDIAVNTPSVPAGNAVSWDGSPTTLQQYGTVSMPQTPNGSLVVGYMNLSQDNSQGTLTVSSGGSLPVPYTVQAGLKMMSLLVNNWRANNLNLANTSPGADAPILVEAYGPGIPGIQPVPLPIGTQLQLGWRQSAQGITNPNNMQLTLTSNTANLTIVCIIGGPPDATGNNAYIVAVNAPSGDTGPGTPNPPPAGYYATRGGNSYSFLFNWSSSQVYVANMSPQTAAPVSVTLISL